MELDALQLVNAHLDLIIEFVVTYLIQRYVFLEKGFGNHKKQYAYYALSLCIIMAAAYFFGENPGAIVLMFTESLNMTLARAERLKVKYPELNICRENRFLDKQFTREKTMCMIVFPMGIPIFGLATGFVTPLICTPYIIWDLPDQVESWYQLSILFITAVLLIVFMIAGRKWRERFTREAGSTGIKPWEHGLLCITGCLTLVSSVIINRPISSFAAEYGEKAAAAYGRSLGILGAISFFLTLTAAILVIINNQRAYLNGKVSDMQLNIITMMADIVENRDENTGGHIRRTAKYVEIIARELKREKKFEDILTDSYISDMIIAAPLHDIGKIHVSDRILNKPGRLDAGEFEQMKSHAAEGRKLLMHAREQIGDFSYIDIAIDMAGSHHEWWDGSEKGYPDRISGEEIPLCARIMAVADVFDALISKRCYKEAMPLSRAYAIIDSESGTHFDPEVVRAFDACRDEIEAAIPELCENDMLQEAKMAS